MHALIIYRSSYIVSIMINASIGKVQTVSDCSIRVFDFYSSKDQFNFYIVGKVILSPTLKTPLYLTFTTKSGSLTILYCHIFLFQYLAS